MSVIKVDGDLKVTEIELKSELHSDTTENGCIHRNSSPDKERTSPADDNEAKRRTKWTSVRNVIKATNVVKKPMSARKKTSVSRQDSFLKKFSTRQHYRTDSEESLETQDESPDVVFVHSDITVFKPDGSLMFYWLLVVTIAVLYNLWTCIVRQAFRELQDDHRFMWITLDIASDTIYILDIIAQLRTGYLEQGLMVLDAVKLAQRYIRSIYFKIDIISLLPLDFIQFAVGWQPLLRFPRFLKVHRALRFLYMLETRTAYPNFVRVANLTHMLFLGCHWFAAFYFMISEAEGFHSEWSYPEPSGHYKELTRKYLASLFWSTLTLTTIGDLPAPETNWEYVFVIGSYLIGVFIFATIVGQVGNVITNRNASRLEFERLLDGAKLYMRMHNVPPPVQRRVQRWYDYVWTRGRMTGSDINSLGLLPDKLKTELAIHVNLETLKKVTIFNECQPEFLHDLVLKMKAYIFTPGDLICRRGEVAREMFIIADGVVEIIRNLLDSSYIFQQLAPGKNGASESRSTMIGLRKRTNFAEIAESESGSILTQMSTGNFFGEIGILNLDGGINRRTADVKSVGYSELFVLSREDVLEALKDHPDAKEIIRKYAEQRLQKVLQDRKKLQETRSNTPTTESTLSHLLICPSNTLFLSSGRRHSVKHTHTMPKHRKHSTSKLDKLCRRSKKYKSKYRVGMTSGESEKTIQNNNGDSPIHILSGNNVSDCNLDPSESEGHNCIVTDNVNDLPESYDENCMSSAPILNVVHRHSNTALTNTAECDRNASNIDQPLNIKITVTTPEHDKNGENHDNKDISSTEVKPDYIQEAQQQSKEKACCRCGQLEEKLHQIEKQLISVERLYVEGIKQLETFNDINERYVQLLNMISDPKEEEQPQSERVAEQTQTTKL